MRFDSGRTTTGAWRRGRRGFTLLEVMISVAILGVIMILIWSSTSQSLRAKDRVEARDLAFHQGRVALRKIGDDLTMAFLAKGTTSAAPGATGPVRTFFIGEDKGERDELRFTAISHLRLFAASKESDQAKIAYLTRPNAEDGALVDIVRREQPWFDDATEVETRDFVLAEKVRTFEIEYFDEKRDDWTGSWDAAKAEFRDRLPLAVRVRIAFVDPDDEDESIPLSTAVLIPLQEPVEL